MFHIDGTMCQGKDCKSVWCTATEPMTMGQIRAEIAKTAQEKGWAPRSTQQN